MREKGERRRVDKIRERSAGQVAVSNPSNFFATLSIAVHAVASAIVLSYYCNH